MQNIALPKKIDFKKGDGENHGLITVEPLFPGYGMTLGNSLRRVFAFLIMFLVLLFKLYGFRVDFFY